MKHKSDPPSAEPTTYPTAPPTASNTNSSGLLAGYSYTHDGISAKQKKHKDDPSSDASAPSAEPTTYPTAPPTASKANSSGLLAGYSYTHDGMSALETRTNPTPEEGSKIGVYKPFDTEVTLHK